MTSWSSSAPATCWWATTAGRSPRGCMGSSRRAGRWRFLAAAAPNSPPRLSRFSSGEGAGGVRWECLVGGKGLRPGVTVQVQSEGRDGSITATILAETESGGRIVAFDPPVQQWLWDTGEVPLPPYIHAPLADPERYQTIYSRIEGSVASSTAGLHFTPELMLELREPGSTWRSSPCTSGWIPSGRCRSRRSSSIRSTGSGPS